MSIPLFKQMMSLYARGMFSYALGSAFYMLLMFWLYPSIAKNSASINELIQGLPEGVGSAFGLQSGFGSVEAFISGEYYGLILVLILSVFCTQFSTQLVAKLVDQGAMAYLLSAPVTRGKVALTQAAVLFAGLFVIVAVTTLAGFAGYAWFVGGGNEFSPRFLQLNLVVLALFFAVSGISFLVSCLSNDEKRALSISGIITFGFFTMDLLGKISGSIGWLRSLSLFSLYRPGEIAAGTAQMGYATPLLFLIGLAGFAAGIAMFKRRDLPL
ncbi:ABC transporter permease subunit [Paenibacillus beijingensis]|uniref:Permease n=1 Tax=Paenibacillus beijingensis TaxID=1126833 RepID=A0A0D5NLU9_9BACL|nr:ABC transporter permease subunit [Paenibacillus beijingensis]AJY76304.1 permease [Paenibacillus beijingensis]